MRLFAFFCHATTAAFHQISFESSSFLSQFLVFCVVHKNIFKTTSLLFVHTLIVRNGYAKTSITRNFVTQKIEQTVAFFAFFAFFPIIALHFLPNASVGLFQILHFLPFCFCFAFFICLFCLPFFAFFAFFACHAIVVNHLRMNMLVTFFYFWPLLSIHTVINSKELTKVWLW